MIHQNYENINTENAINANFITAIRDLKISDDISDEVEAAFKNLCKAGFDKCNV